MKKKINKKYMKINRKFYYKDILDWLLNGDSLENYLNFKDATYIINCKFKKWLKNNVFKELRKQIKDVNILDIIFNDNKIEILLKWVEKEK